MEIKSRICLKDGKLTFEKPAPSRNGWFIIICAAQYVRRALKRWKGQVLTTLRTDAWIKISLRTHLVLSVCTVFQKLTLVWDSLQMPWRLISVITLLLEVCVTQTVSMTMTLSFWIVYIPSSRNLCDSLGKKRFIIFCIWNERCLREQLTLMPMQVDCIMRCMMQCSVVIMAVLNLFEEYQILVCCRIVCCDHWCERNLGYFCAYKYVITVILLSHL
jgi:hypothetical protein